MSQSPAHTPEVSLIGDAFTSDCPGRDVFNHLTSRWGLLILTALEGGPLRFHELRNEVDGVSEKMLSQTLKVLARDGLVARHVEPTVPPRVSYELTALGQEAAAPLRELIRWIGARIHDILAARQQYDAAQ